MNKLISIFIPTYNRAEILKTVLSKVVDVVSVHQIKIYVYDNASTDNTESVVRFSQQSYEHIQYYKNETNLGPDRNMLNILDFVGTKYVLMLGDDDYVLPNFCELLKPYLERDFSFMVLARQEDYLKEKTQIFSDRDQAFSFLWEKMPYGTVIMRTGVIQKDDVAKYIGTSHAYSAICWEMLSKENTTCLYLSETLSVYLGVVEKTWNSSAMDILYYQIPLWFSLLPENYKSKDTIYLKSKKIRFTLRSLISCKARYNFSTLSSKEFFTTCELFKFEVISVIPFQLLRRLLKRLNVCSIF